MKKILATILALTMVLSLGAIAFADNPGTEANNSTGENITEVTGSNTKSLAVGLDGEVPEPDPEYSVNIKWDSLQFTYSGASAAEGWQAGTHTYTTDASDGTWSNGSGDTAIITVTNHSNVAVKAASSYTGTYTSGSDVDGVTVTFTGISGEGNLTAGVVDKPDEAASTTCTVKVEGAPDATLNNVTAGTITITISAGD